MWVYRILIVSFSWNVLDRIATNINPWHPPELYWWVRSSLGGHCRWRRRGRWDASRGCSSACWTAPCPACSWSGRPPAKQSREQTTTSDEGQQTDIFFRHFQVKLSEPSETELSILLALATLSFFYEKFWWPSQKIKEEMELKYTSRFFIIMNLLMIIWTKFWSKI